MVVMSVRRSFAAAVGLVLALAACGQTPQTAPAPGTDGLRVMATVPNAPGYDRGCGRGDACVFGPAWSDDVSGRYGHNGCDQRSDVLREQLTEVVLKPGAHGCVVASGVLNDPYTGARVEYRRGDRSLDVDHVVPLAGAWDRGAAKWTARRRQDLAGDPRNLIVTTAAANRSKGDKAPAEWSPTTTAGRCAYASRYVAVSVAYDLAVTPADVVALELMLTTCPPD